jgi:hypothetical protein
MAADVKRTLRGALAGAVAAGVWAAQQPLDRRAFGVAFDDLELLGKLVTRARGWPAVGLALHLANGALFGAAYASVAPRLALPSPARGPTAALTEHVLTWPAVRITDRRHPARGELPTLNGNRPAFWQAAWRHLVFGVVLGELERRLNPPAPPAPPPFAAIVSSNGHRSLEDAVPAEPAG